jgi:hypothetical protein
MALARTRTFVLVLLAGLMVCASSAFCLELKLSGASLGDTPEELLASASFGPPDGVFTPGNVFNSTKAQPGELPVWAMAVRMEQIAPGQVQWVYNRDPAAVGIVLSGQGINAHVTDIVVSLWRTFEASRVAGSSTSKGARIGSTFADVLERYGWPNRLQIIAEAPQTPTTPTLAAAGSTMATGIRPGAFRPGGIRFSLGGRRAGAGGRTPQTPALGAAATGAAGLGAFGFGRKTTGPGPLPGVGPTLAAPLLSGVPRVSTGPVTSTTADVGQTPSVTFTKSCILSYPSVDFLVYRMKVFRIHVYGR